MAEPCGSQASDAGTPKFAAPKDKNCPYCGQAFTSSSLGRHLDLYIKEKNPKPPDGIHDVEAIKKMRGGITRRQPRGSLGGRREPGTTPAGTPRSSKKETPVPETDPSGRSTIPRDGQYVVDSTLSRFPFVSRWEATGVINDIPARGSWDSEAAPEAPRRPTTQRSTSKQVVQKAQFDVKQKLADAMDTARAAELALREILSSWRSAKQEIDNGSMPFEFDPLSLDFPALTLQCLEPPPTLFSSTQHPTSTSWSVQAPGQREYSALQAFFDREFEAWKITCASATTAFTEELVYPPTNGRPFRDVGEAVKKAEKTADQLEKQVTEHLQSAYAVWESLPEQRRTELWVLELARGVGRKNKDLEKKKSDQHRLRQENTNLRAQIDQLNRLQQPREFKILSPSTFPIDRDLIANAYGQGVREGKSLGFDVQDRKYDLGTVVTKAIERWKNVITSTRVSSTGMSAQKPLDPNVQSPAPGNPASPSQSQGTPLPPKSAQSQHASQQSQSQQEKRLSVTSTNEQASEQATTSNSNTAPPSVVDTSDQDADAEMEDDDSFAIMHPSPMKQSQGMQQQAQLDVPRTRGQAQQQGTPDMRFMMQNGAASPAGRNSMSMSRSMPNMNMGMQGSPMQDMGMPMQGVRGDMYME